MSVDLTKSIILSKADKMFEKLGYIKTETKTELGYISQNGDYFIMFILTKRGICIHKDNTEYPAMSMQALHAINEKCKELGWNNE